jgi:hypothetical protein
MGISLADLKAIPEWATLLTRVRTLEDRVAALEAVPKWKRCTACGSVMTVVSEKPDPVFGPMGKKLLGLRCTCGAEAERTIDPRKD